MLQYPFFFSNPRDSNSTDPFHHHNLTSAVLFTGVSNFLGGSGQSHILTAVEKTNKKWVGCPACLFYTILLSPIIPPTPTYSFIFYPFPPCSLSLFSTPPQFTSSVPVVGQVRNWPRTIRSLERIITGQPRCSVTLTLN